MRNPDRSKMPPLQAVPWLKMPVVETAMLSNGIPVYIIPFGVADVAEVVLIFNEGRWLEQVPGQSFFCTNLLSEGTRGMSGKTFAEQTSFFGASISAHRDADYFSTSLSCLTRYLSDTLPLLREFTFFPAFQEDEFLLLKERKLQGLEVEMKNTGFVARQKFQRLMYGTRHPYGMTDGPEEIDGVMLEEVKAYHRSLVRKRGCSIIVTGNVKPEQILPLLETHILSEKLPDLAEIKLLSQEIPAFNPGSHFFPLPETTQATVRMGHLAFKRDHADYTGMDVVNTILGGYFGSRLMKNIREDKGLTYGIGSAWLTSKFSGYFIVQTDCANEYVEQVRMEVKKEIEKLIQDGTDENELTIVKNYLVGKALSSRETPSGIAGKILYATGMGLSFSIFDAREEELKSITPAMVRDLAEKYIHPGKMLEVVCGEG